MKSTNESLRKRGMASEGDIAALSDLTYEDLVAALHAADSCTRSAAAYCLRVQADRAADELLGQLAGEKCLYTRIAVCECLEKGSIVTSEKMISCLGHIGNNQYRVPPDKVSAKKSFPLPRDIIARSLGRMDISVFPAFQRCLRESRYREQISELVDAVGYMVFYHPELAAAENLQPVLALESPYSQDSLILWKMILCLSAFPSADAKTVLLNYAQEQSILGMEAQRSLKILAMRKGTVYGCHTQFY